MARPRPTGRRRACGQARDDVGGGGGDQGVTLEHGKPRPVRREARRVLRLIQKTINARGQVLLVPDFKLEGWTSSLPTMLNAQAVIGLYADRGTHEEFHPEFNTYLDLTRLSPRN